MSMAAHGARRLAAMAENAVCRHRAMAAAQGCDFHAPMASSAPLERYARGCVNACRGSSKTATCSRYCGRRRSRARARSPPRRRRTAKPRRIECVTEPHAGRGFPMPIRLDNARVIRAPRGRKLGQELADRSAAADAHEQPRSRGRREPAELVVYGGIGRAARNWECFDASSPHSRRSADETLLVQSGKPVGVFQDSPRCAARADRQLKPRTALGNLGTFQRARPQGSDDVRPDDRRLVDLHRLAKASCRARTRRSPRSDGATTAATSQAGGFLLPALAAWAARSRWRRLGGRLAADVECQPSPHRAAARQRAISTPRRGPGRGARADRAACREGKPLSIGVLGNAAECVPELVRRGVRPDVVTDQTARTIRSTAICRRAGASLNGKRRRDRSRRRAARGASSRCAGTCARCSNSTDGGFRPSTTATTFGRWRMRRESRRVRFSGIRPAYIRPLFCRGKGPFRWAALSGDPKTSIAPMPRSRS